MRITRRLLLVLGCLVGSSCGFLLPSGAGAATTTFLPTGAEQTFTVPAGVTSVRVIAVGGRGGAGGGSSSGAGGFGAVVQADLSVTPGEVLYVNVGGNGTDGNAGGAGGFNGGGSSGQPAGSPGGGGGGASDVRTISRSIGTSPFSRLVVAGGGGGGGASSANNVGGDAGEAGADAFFSGSGGGQPGTDSDGGAGGNGGCDGLPGQLGTGGDSVGGACTGGPPGVGGAGGGGLYGGGAGGTSSDGAGGGGGSSGFAAEAANTSVAIDNTGSPAISLIYEAAPPALAFGTDTNVTLALAKKRIPKGGPVPALVENGNAFAVTGQLAATGVGKGASEPVPATSFEVGAGATADVRAKLSPKLKRKLKRKKKLSLNLAATVEDPAGNSRVVNQKIKVKLKRK